MRADTTPLKGYYFFSLFENLKVKELNTDVVEHDTRHRRLPLNSSKGEVPLGRILRQSGGQIRQNEWERHAQPGTEYTYFIDNQSTKISEGDFPNCCRKIREK